MKIKVTKRSNDYHACINGNKGLWGCGRTISEAIGDVVQSHPEQHDIKIEIDIDGVTHENPRSK